MKGEDFLELSNSKSNIGSQSTALNSVTKLGSVEKLLEDQDSMTFSAFSDILRGDFFKTPQKSCFQLFPHLKGSPPTKSEIKSDNKGQLGKRTDLEKQFLDSHLEDYMSKLSFKKTQSYQNPRSELGNQGIPKTQLTAPHTINRTFEGKKNKTQAAFEFSTKIGVCREKLDEDMHPYPLVDHKLLFERLKVNSTLKAADIKPLHIDQNSGFKFNQTLNSGQVPLLHPLGVAEIVKLCQKTSSDALDMIASIQEERKRQLNVTVPVADTCSNCFKNDSSTSDDLMASSESLSLKNFPSSTRKSSEVAYTPESLPEPLFLLFTKFCQLDFMVFETTKMGKVSLWENHVANLQKLVDL